MRFLVRSLTGLALTLLTAALIGYGGWRLSEGFAEKEPGPRRPAVERAYAVEYLVPRPLALRPVLTAHGAVRSARRLEIRPAQGGAIAELSPSFRDGGAVEAGAILARIDPAAARSDLARAEIALEEAEAEVRLAAAAVELARKDFEGAGRQRDLHARALARQESLRDRGVGTDAAVESASLALAAAEQGSIAREQALASAQSRRIMAGVALDRARLAREDAARALAETEIRAPFAGLLRDTAVALGRRVNAGEKIGELIDPGAFEVAVELSAADYARLTGPGPGGARPEASALVRLDLGQREATFPGRIARSGAASAAGGAGRVVFVSVEGEAAARTLRDGDFVTVEIEEPALENVARIPAAAADAAGVVLTVTADDRLAPHPTRILRRLGNDLIVADAPFGQRMVTLRKPQLGAGIKVQPFGPEPEPEPEPEASGEADAGRPPEAEAGGPAREVDVVALSPDRRARLAEVVRASGALPPERKASLLAGLEAPELPRDMLERLERMERDAAAASDG